MQRNVLDDLDIDILSFLEQNSKMRIHVMSRKLGVPASTVHHRIRRLESLGIIKKWTIAKDYCKLGYSIKAHVLIFTDISLLSKMGITQDDIARELMKIRYVESVDVIAGKADLMITIRARDVSHLENLLLNRIQGVGGVVKTETLISLKEFSK